MLKAESGLDPKATRQAMWPDWSAGLCQMSVETAARFGIGGGVPSSWEIVKEALFQPPIAIDLGTRLLSYSYQKGLADPDLEALIAYNSGSFHQKGDWYWLKYQGNIANYQAALAWAKEILGI